MNMPICNENHMYISQSENKNFVDIFLFRPTKLMSVLSLSGVVTSLLFLIMHLLIAVEYSEPTVEQVPVFKDVVMPKPKPIVTTYKKPKLVDNVPPPEMNLEKSKQIEGAPLTVSVNTDLDFKLKDFKISMGSNDYPIAQYVSQPRYPSRALSNGIEGFVDVQFDVDELGKTQNISIISASPQGVFEKSALKSVAKWRYQPKLKDGVPTYFSGVKSRVRFNISD